MGFTGHAVLVVSPHRSDSRLIALGVDGFGRAHDPRLVAELAGNDAWIDSLDVLLVSRGTGSPGSRPGLVSRGDLAGHPRAQFARAIRDDVRVLGYADPRRAALAVIARGLAGLAELSFELEPARRGDGTGATLVRDALAAVPAGQLIVAAVAPGNAASLRAMLSAGFVPVGSVQLFGTSPAPT